MSFLVCSLTLLVCATSVTLGQAPDQPQQQDGGASVVSTACLGCICEASSGCNTTIGCVNGFCGPFLMSRPFFADSELHKEPEFEPYSFEACAQDPRCSASAIRKYMLKYRRDCTGDGRVSCTDYALIHKSGPNACSNPSVVNTLFFQRFAECIQFARID